MKTLSKEQITYVQQVMKKTKQTRSKITLYKTCDESYAQFRVNACNQIIALTIAHSTNQALSQSLSDYWQHWINDAPGGLGDNFREYVTSLEEAVGKPVKWLDYGSSLPRKIVKKLAAQHAQACSLMVDLLEAINLEDESVLDNNDDRVQICDLSTVLSDIISRLSACDITSKKEDRALSIMLGLIEEFQSVGISFESKRRETIEASLVRSTGMAHLVRWEIDSDAESPLDAAIEARKYQRDHDSSTTVFSVIDREGIETLVDLDDIEELVVSK